VASSAATTSASSIALLRCAEQLERDKAQLDQNNTQLTQTNAQLIRDKTRLQRQLNEHAEAAVQLTHLQEEMRRQGAELTEACRLLMKAEAAATAQAEQSGRSLEGVQQQLVENEDDLKTQTATVAHDATGTRRLLDAQTKVNQQLERDKAQLVHEKAQLSQANAQLTEDKAQLRLQFDERITELTAAQSQSAAATGQAEQHLRKRIC
jgi:hypothetical protein